MKRKAAMLLFPRESLRPNVFDQVKREGYTDVLIFVMGELGFHATQSQCFSIGDGAEADRLASERGLGMIVSTDYLKDVTRRSDLTQPLKREPEHQLVWERSDEPSRLLCPFHPKNLEAWFGVLEQICGWESVRDILLNDEARLSTLAGEQLGCYCQHCRDDFGRMHGVDPPMEREPDSQVWWDWIHYRMDRWTEIHAEARERVKSVRPEIRLGRNHNGYDFSFVENSVTSAVNLAEEAKTLDVISSNAYHGFHSWQFTGPDYMPARRYVTEVVRLMRGVALDKPVNIRAQGFMPASTSVLEMSRRDGLLAGSVPYCLGAETVTAFTYELMHTIPGFSDGFDEATRLVPHFERTEPWAFATVLHPSQTEIHGHPLEKWGANHLRAWVNTMFHLGLPWQWLVDARMEARWLEGSRVLIVPDAVCLTAGQMECIDEFIERGGSVLWIGEMADGEWDGESHCPPKAQVLARECVVALESGTHPVLSGIELPVVLSSAIDRTGLEGEVLASFEGQPVLTVVDRGKGREAWLAGRPVYDLGDPYRHSAMRVETDSLRFLRNLLYWLSPSLPMVELDPYPPMNAYRWLRPWDRRDRPTFEAFPLIGDGLLMVVMVNYVGCTYDTNLVLRPPGAKRESMTLKELVSGREINPEVARRNGSLQIPIHMTGEELWRVYTLEW